MSAAIVKGIAEHKDGTRFFGSLMSYRDHFEVAIEQGLVIRSKKMPNKGTLTAKAKEWYTRCLKDLPQCRQVFWENFDPPKE